MSLMQQDKKNLRGRHLMSLLEAVGKAIPDVPVSDEDVLWSLQKNLSLVEYPN